MWCEVSDTLYLSIYLPTHRLCPIDESLLAVLILDADLVHVAVEGAEDHPPEFASRVDAEGEGRGSVDL